MGLKPLQLFYQVPAFTGEMSDVSIPEKKQVGIAVGFNLILKT